MPLPDGRSIVASNRRSPHFAFVLNHPAITAAIIGPRTIQHLDTQLAAARVQLGSDVLDRIDEIVPPGTTINPVDNSFANPALEPSARRR